MIKMEEILCSIRNYTKFSGGDISLYSLAGAALECGLDVIFVTDKNIYLQGHDQYYYKDGRKLLFMFGEELSDPVRKDVPRYISLGIEKEQFNRRISAPQNEIRIFIEPEENGSFIKYFEIINSEEILNRGLDASQKKIRERMKFFDGLQARDYRCTGIVGTCLSAERHSFGPKEILSTAFNHVFIDEPLTGDFIHDKMTVYKALRSGRVFMAVDGLSDAKGFRFTAEGDNRERVAYPGDTIFLKSSITFKISAPEACVCRLIRDGKPVKEWQQCRQVPYTIYEPGCYRVECALPRRKELYDWIFTNPIYAVKG